MTETLDQLEQSRSLIQEPVILREEASLGIRDRIHDLYDSSVNAIKRTSLKLGATALTAAAVMGGGFALAEASPALAKTKAKAEKITAMVPFTLIKDVNNMNNDINGGGGGLNINYVHNMSANYNTYTMDPLCKKGVEGTLRYTNTLAEQLTYPCPWVGDSAGFVNIKPRFEPLPNDDFETYIVNYGTQALNSAKKYLNKSMVANVGNATDMTGTQKIAHIYYESAAEEKEESSGSNSNTTTTNTITTANVIPTAKYELTLKLSSNNKTDKLPVLVRTT